MSVHNNLYTPAANSGDYTDNPFNRHDPANPPNRPHIPNEVALNILQFLPPAEAHRFMTITKSEMGMNRIENQEILASQKTSLNIKDLAQYQIIFALDQLDESSESSWCDFVDRRSLKMENVGHLDLSGSQLTLQEFGATLKCCPNLTSINLKGCNLNGGLTIEKVQTVAKHCPRLTSISMDQCISREVLQEIGRCFPNLQTISLPGNFIQDYTENALIDVLIANFHNLTSITFTGRSTVTDDGILRLAQKYQNLTSFSIGGPSDATYFSDAIFDAFIAHCPNMRSLKIHGSYYITDVGVARFARAYPNLTRLSLPGCGHVTDASIQAIVDHCPNITSLDFHCCKVTEAGVKLLAGSCPNLTSINFFAADYISHATFEAFFKAHPNLKAIDLSCNGKFTNDDLAALARYCPKLSMVDLHFCDRLTNSGISAFLKACPNLTKIRLSVRDNITPDGLTALTESPKLAWVDLLPGIEMSAPIYMGYIERERAMTQQYRQRETNRQLAEFKNELTRRGIEVEKPLNSHSISQPFFD